MCSLKKFCDEGTDGRKDCDRRNKLCFPKEKGVGHECRGLSKTAQCLEGMDENRNKVCVDKCQKDNVEELCAQYYGYCDPTVNPTDGALKSLCKCRPGFVQTESGKDFYCKLGRKTFKFNLNIKDNFKNGNLGPLPLNKLNHDRFSSDLKGFYEQIKSINKLNLDRYVKFTKNIQDTKINEEILTYAKELIKHTDHINDMANLRIQKCELKDGYYNCIFVITLSERKTSNNYSNKTITDQLKELCIPFDGKEECFFPLSTPTKRSASTFYQLSSGMQDIVMHKKDLDKEPDQFKVHYS